MQSPIPSKKQGNKSRGEGGKEIIEVCGGTRWSKFEKREVGNVGCLCKIEGLVSLCQLWIFKYWFLQNKVMKVFFMLIQIHENFKLIKNIFGRHGQKWGYHTGHGTVELDVSQRRNWWDKLISYMMLEIQESWWLFQ